MATTLEPLTAGDSRSYALEFKDKVTSNPIDITNGIIKFTAKRDIRDENNACDIFRASHVVGTYVAGKQAGIAITNAVGGLAQLNLRPTDTEDLQPASLKWDIELTRRQTLRTSAGSCAVTAPASGDSFATLTFTGADLSLVEKGDVLVVSGSLPGNTISCTVEAVTATTIQTDYLAWNTESGMAFQIYSSIVSTPDGMSGTLRICHGVTL